MSKSLDLFQEGGDAQVVSVTDAHLSFDEFWSLYPKKVARQQAWSAWERLSWRGREAALESIRRWRRVWLADGQDPKFLPHASTWLNQGRWEDEVPEPASQRPASAAHVVATPPPVAPRSQMPEEVRAMISGLVRKVTGGR